MADATISIVIPAHDEGLVIGPTLEAVLAQDVGGPLDIIIVANGCEDDTATIAGSFVSRAEQQGHAMRVVELSRRGKAFALNAGDEAASAGARVYLDADVVISPRTISLLLDRLGRDGTEYVAPTMAVQLPRNRIVRAYLTVWLDMPYVLEGGAGRGVYAVSAAGRSRWGDFPDVLADDTFARLHFDDAEVLMVDGATVTKWFPESVSEMVGVRGRLFLGLWQMHQRYPELMSRDTPRGRVALRTIATTPRLWLRAPAFFGIYVLGWVSARRAMRRDDYSWSRDQTSRERS